jgi:predicted nucleotidyltransferase
MIELAPDHLAAVRRLVAIHAPECEVRAFGSRVAGTAKPYSDLDLAFVGPGRIPLPRLSALREAFQESELPMRVDVLDWHRIPDSFQRVIENRFEVIQHPTGSSHARENRGEG